MAANAASIPAHAGDEKGGGLWLSAGQNTNNTRFQSDEVRISPSNVARLGTKWIFTTGGDVSATPAVDAQRVYVPDWKGNLYAVDRKTGAQIWSTKIADATGVPGDLARATPAVTGNRLVIGTQGMFGGGGNLLSYDARTGVLLWKTKLETNPFAIVTQSATVSDGVVYIGVASNEEGVAVQPGYPCCTFRGSLLAVDLTTGAILWKTYMVPAGYPGGAIWGSSPAVDTKRKQVYVATGNNYTVPPSTLQCVAAAGTNVAAIQSCIPADNLVDAIVALDLATGRVKWSTAALPYDAWTVSCIPFLGDGSNCPQPAGPDYDFGQAPALFSVKGTGKQKELVGAGQKSGQYWAVDPDTGAVQWVTQAGPGGTGGGLQWGSAVDDKRIYTANSNSNYKPTTVRGNTVSNGVWSALDKATGALIWQQTTASGRTGSLLGTTAGPVTTANGVVFGCSLDILGYMYALDAATGAILWEFASGGSCLSGAAISNGEVYWGSGYANLGAGTSNNKLYAFEIK
jgi:polyvinyl alcohol dehydrogenase (cytochrome)